MKIVYLITQQIADTYIGFPSNFKPEIYTEKSIAEKRFKRLQSERKKYSGLFYEIEEIEINKNNNN